VAETVFDTVNQEADKVEQKKRAKQKQKFDTDEKGTTLGTRSIILSISIVLTMLLIVCGLLSTSLCGSVGKDFVYYHACGHEFESRLK